MRSELPMLEKGDEPVPGYRLEAFLGRGQFGEVWRATSPGGARVALKFLNLDERQGLKEFRAIQRIKSIRYPHLTSVTALWLLDEAGNVLDDSAIDSYMLPAPSQRETLLPCPVAATDGRPHRLVVATSLCDKNLLDRLAECQAQGLGGIPVDELLRYMEEAAKGIDFLNSPRHDLGEGPVAIQHCDIKPANIMLTGDSVMICDFGVASFLSDLKVAVTGTSMAGSPAYMSPECTQCRPSAASDQYSLGVTYTELRTGKLPFHCQSWMDVIQAHRDGTLDFSPLPAGEQTVIRKATSLDPADRYPSAVAMVSALRHAVESTDHAAPTAKPRRQLAAIVAVLALLAAVGAAAVVLIPWEKPGSTLSENDHSSVPEVTVSFQVVPSDAEVIVDGSSLKPDVKGRVVLTRPPEARVEITVRKLPEYREYQQVMTVTELKTPNQIIELQLDAEYTRVLARTHANRAFDIVDSDQPHLPNLDLAANEYRQAMVLDKSRYAVVPPPVRHLQEAEQEYNFTIRCMAVHSQQPWLVARYRATQIALWSLADLDAPHTILHEHSSHVCNVVTYGSYVASADLTGQIKVTQLDENWQPQETFESAEFNGLELAFAPNLQWLIAGDYEGNVRGWRLNASDDSNVPILIGRHEQSVRGVAVTADSQWVITAGEDGLVCKWNLENPDPTSRAAQLGSQLGDVSTLTLSPGGRSAALGAEAANNDEFQIYRVDLISNVMQALPPGHTAPVSALAYDRYGDLRPEQSDSALLASGDESGQIQFYDGDASQLLNSRHIGAIRSLTFCPARGWLVSASDDGTVGVCDLLHTDRSPLVLDGGAGRAVQVLATPHWLIVGYYNGAIMLWDLRRCLLVKRAADAEGIELYDESVGKGTIKT